MNERIKELIAQVGGIRHDDDGNELTPALVGKSLEKFAKLIVGECISKLDDIGVIDRDSRTIAMKVISEHFGVKE